MFESRRRSVWPASIAAKRLPQGKDCFHDDVKRSHTPTLKTDLLAMDFATKCVGLTGRTM